MGRALPPKGWTSTTAAHHFDALQEEGLSIVYASPWYDRLLGGGRARQRSGEWGRWEILGWYCAEGDPGAAAQARADYDMYQAA